MRSTKANMDEHNFTTIFSVLVISLDLRPSPQAGLRQVFNKTHCYAFKAGDAIKHMANLHFEVDLRPTQSAHAYSFDPDTSLFLLKRFFAAHFLHHPSSRTETRLSVSSTLQITPKGVAIVTDFCKSLQIKACEMPQVARSSFNTMNLFRFDRALATNKILYSKHMNHILLSAMLGSSPNVWLAEALPQPVANVLESELVADPNVQFGASKALALAVQVSPFHHRYFTNPESDAHIQYYERESGMRVFVEDSVDGAGLPDGKHYHFSGKVFVQWLCDCATVYSPQEAVEIGQLMVNYGVITPMGQSTRFLNLRDALYTSDELNSQACQWGFVLRDLSDESIITLSISCDSELFQKILADPGTRHLFKSHLEKEKCAENFDAYIQLRDFLRHERKLARLFRYYVEAQGTSHKTRLENATTALVEKCMALAADIYWRNFSTESNCNLNIDFEVQKEIDFAISQLGVVALAQCDDTFDNEDYLQTPVAERADMDKLLDQRPFAPKTTENGLSERVRHLASVNLTFCKITNSIYRLMEVDLFPKFLQSREFALVAEQYCAA